MFNKSNKRSNKISKKQTKNRPQKMKHLSRIIILNYVISTFFIALVASLVANAATIKNMKQIFKDDLKKASEVCVTNLNNIDLESDDVDAILSQMKNNNDYEYTIFKGDTRIKSTVKSAKDTIVGTQMSSKLKKYVDKKKVVTGLHKLDGKNYLLNATYMGDYTLVVGRDCKALVSKIIGGLLWVFFIVCSIHAIISVVFYRYIKLRLTEPMKALTALSSEISSGNVGINEDNEKLLKDVDKYSKGNTDIANLVLVNKNTYDSLNDKINRTCIAVDEIGNGNLLVDTNLGFDGDFVKIEESLTKIKNDFKDAMLSINETSEQVSSGCGEIASSAQNLASGATKQAGAIEQVTSSMSHISQGVRENVKSTVFASNSADNAHKLTHECNELMGQLQSSMDDIDENSKEINNIVKTIDDIAFQTNILALNASVEAARAGAAGKGFAVVASEVRSLAEKSANAVTMTTELINHSNAAISQGVEMTNRTSEALEKVNNEIKSIDEIINNIAEGAKNQEQSVAETETALGEVSVIIQSNAASAEESAASSEELSSQSLQMVELVNKFRIVE